MNTPTKFVLAASLLFAGAAAGQPESVALSNATVSGYGAVRIADSPDLSPQQLTLEVRIMPGGAGYESSDEYGAHVLTKFAEGQGMTFASGYALRWSPATQKVNFAVAHAFDGSGFILFSNGLVPVGRAARVSATFDGATAKLYINGVLDAQLAAGFSSVFYAPADLRLGAGNGPGGFARRFQGLIDDARVWNRALSVSEIAAGCEAGGPAPGLVGAWTFTGGSYADVSGNGHSGVPEGAVALVAQPAQWASPPVITAQPTPGSQCGTNRAGFSVAADGTGPFTYQWEIEAAPGVWQGLGNDPAPLVCGGQAFATPINSPQVTLGVSPCPGVNLYQVRCVVTNGCGSATSNEAALSISSADFNNDGDIGTDADIEAFFACLAGDCCAACDSADFNGDGDVGTDADIEAFFRVLAGGSC